MKKNTNKLFFVNYEPRRMTVLTASMSPLADLAARRLCDWTWIEGYPPPNDPAIVAAIAKCSPQGLAFADLAEAAKPPGANAEEASNPLGRDLEGSSNPPRTGIRTPFELITINDKR